MVEHLFDVCHHEGPSGSLVLQKEKKNTAYKTSQTSLGPSLGNILYQSRLLGLATALWTCKILIGKSKVKDL